MNHTQLVQEARGMSRFEKHRFMILVGATIAISLVLVVLSMWLYTSSGASQLDLSRPGYVSVREQVDGSNQFKDFSATGPVTDTTIDEFTALYDEQVKRVGEDGGFGSQVLSNKALSIEDPALTKRR